MKASYPDVFEHAVERILFEITIQRHFVVFVTPRDVVALVFEVEYRALK